MREGGGGGGGQEKPKVDDKMRAFFKKLPQPFMQIDHTENDFRNLTENYKPEMCLVFVEFEVKT